MTGKETGDDTGQVNVGAILDEAMRHMKLSQVYPGTMMLFEIFSLP